MAPDVINPLPNVLPHSRTSDDTTDPVDAPQQTSSIPSSLNPRLYPIFDPPGIKSKRLAKEKAASLAQFDDKLRTAIFDDDDDLPPSVNI